MAATKSTSKKPDKNTNSKKNETTSDDDSKVKKSTASKKKPASLKSDDGASPKPKPSFPSPTGSIGEKLPPLDTPTGFDAVANNARTSGNMLLDQVPKGFKNPGNLCYRNSILALLFSAAPFLGYFLPHAQDLKVKAVDGGDLIKSFCKLIAAYTASPDPSDPKASDAACQRHMQDFWKVIAKLEEGTDGQNSWLPWDVNRAARREPRGGSQAAIDAVKKYNEKARKGQQDAQEFLHFFLKNLQFQLAEGLSPPSAEVEIFQQLCTFTQTQYLVCNCRVGSQRKDRRKMQTLSRIGSFLVNCRLEHEAMVPSAKLPDTDLVTMIEGSLNAPLEGWRCEACLKPAKPNLPPPATTQADDDNDGQTPSDEPKGVSYTKEKIYYPPEVFFMHLGRFAGYFDGTSKINRFVEIPEIVNVQDFVEKKIVPQGTNLNYKLVATVLHSGTVSGGHYTCVVRRPGQPGQEDDWYLLNDDVVTLESDGMGLINKKPRGKNPFTPYILVYVREDSGKQTLNQASITTASPDSTSKAITPPPDSVDDATSAPIGNQKAKLASPAPTNTDNAKASSPKSSPANQKAKKASPPPAVSDSATVSNTKSAGIKRSQESLDFDKVVKSAAKPLGKKDEFRIHLHLVDANGETLVSADRALPPKFDASLLDSVKLGVHITDRSDNQHDVTGKILEFLAGNVDAEITAGDDGDDDEDDSAPTTTADKDSATAAAKTPAPSKAGSKSPPPAPKKTSNAVAGKKRSRSSSLYSTDSKKEEAAIKMSLEPPSDDDSPAKKQKTSSPISSTEPTPRRPVTRSRSAGAVNKRLLSVVNLKIDPTVWDSPTWPGKAKGASKAKAKSPSISPKTPSKAASSKIASPKNISKASQSSPPPFSPLQSPSPSPGAVKKPAKKSSKSGKSSKTTSPK